MLRRTLATSLVATALSFAPAPAQAVTFADELSPARSSAQGDLIALINGYRAANGLQQVSVNGALTYAAAWMANDMASKDYLAHVSSDGRSPTQRMSAFGYPATSMYTGENLAAGYAAASAVLGGWQGSAAHDAVLLNPNYSSIGVGLAYNASARYKWYWAADFGGSGGTVKVVVPPPAPQPLVAPPPPAQPRAQVAAPAAPQRAAPAARDVTAPPQIEPVDPEAAAAAARAAFAEAVGVRRVLHLLLVLERMGGL